MGKQQQPSTLISNESKAGTTDFWKMAALPTLAGLAIVAFVWLWRPDPTKPEIKKSLQAASPPAPSLTWPVWQPNSENDRLVDQFRKARNKDPKAGEDLLAADPVFDEAVPVSEKEADARQAGYFLHRARQISEVRPGEPRAGGGWSDSPNRYTLATRVGGSTPALRIHTGSRVESPSHLFMIDPDIVVEVRDGKLHALRAELHRD